MLTRKQTFPEQGSQPWLPSYQSTDYEANASNSCVNKKTVKQPEGLLYKP